MKVSLICKNLLLCFQIWLKPIQPLRVCSSSRTFLTWIRKCKNNIKLGFCSNNNFSNLKFNSRLETCIVEASLAQIKYLTNRLLICSKFSIRRLCSNYNRTRIWYRILCSKNKFRLANYKLSLWLNKWQKTWVSDFKWEWILE